MNYFTASSRLRELISFKESYLEYLAAKDKDTEAAQKARSELNRLAMAVDESLEQVGCAVFIAAPPPAVGGPFVQVHIARELFNVYVRKVLGVGPKQILDMLEQGIGEYERIARRAFLNLFNPFWWLKEILSFIVSLPFYLLGISGFDQQRIEQSTAAKVLKLIMAVLVLIATITTILVNFNILGWKLPWLG